MKLDYLSPYFWFMQAKNSSLGRSSARSVHGLSVISVGNINTGGSGKTPFIHFLVNEIKAKYTHRKILIISKSYKASLRHPQEVTLQDIHRPEIFGDEPCLLKSLVDADVWSGPNKAETLAAATQFKQYDLAIIDDGFSHRRIQRDLDIVLFDVSRHPKHYQIIPFGFMREPWSALSRADLVFLTKGENQDPGQIDFYKNKISIHQKNVLSLDFTNQIQLKEKNIFLVAGVGNPEALLNSLKQQGYSVRRANLYADHYNFPASEQEKIWDDYCKLKSESEIALVTTAKDAVKIKHVQLSQALKIIDLKISLSEEGLKVLHEKISQLF